MERSYVRHFPGCASSRAQPQYYSRAALWGWARFQLSIQCLPVATTVLSAFQDFPPPNPRLTGHYTKLLLHVTGFGWLSGSMKHLSTKYNGEAFWALNPFMFLFVCLLLACLLETGSHYVRPGWAWVHSESPASASPVLGLLVCTIISSCSFFFLR